MATKKNEVEKILELTGEFVTRQGGAWGHLDWESFLKKAAKAGVTLDDESKRNLGNILEGAKFLYHRAGIMPESKPAKKKAAAKPKAAAKKPAKKKAASK